MTKICLFTFVVSQYSRRSSDDVPSRMSIRSSSSRVPNVCMRSCTTRVIVAIVSSTDASDTPNSLAKYDIV